MIDSVVNVVSVKCITAKWGSENKNIFGRIDEHEGRNEENKGWIQPLAEICLPLDFKCTVGGK